MDSIEKLNFQIQKIEKELNEISMTTFVYNKRIEELVDELCSLRQRIGKLAEQEDNLGE